MSVLSRIAAIASFRAGPQDLPASLRLLMIVVIADILVSLASLTRVLSGGQAFLVVVFSIGLGMLFAYLVLYLRGVSARFRQTAIALFGTDVIISLVALPLSLALSRHIGPDGGANEVPAALAFGLMAVVIWNISVVTRIFREALDQTLLGGFLIALAYVFLTTGTAF